MSHTIPARPLSLTEELERLEQSITLTLQEIDSNFSRAHRVVTGSILPVIEDYARHSNDVWEGSKFWKHFFEASANVSLSGYEEGALDQTNHEPDETLDSETYTEGDHTGLSTPRRTKTTDDGATSLDEDFDIEIDSPSQISGTQATPRLTPMGTDVPSRNTNHRSWTTSSTPRKYTGAHPLGPITPNEGPSTPNARPEPDMQSSPFDSGTIGPGTAIKDLRRNEDDPLMHRVLDKTYRIQATPHGQNRSTRPLSTAKGTPLSSAKSQLVFDSPGSSPEIDVPQLRSELFSPSSRVARVPGVSLWTPGRHDTAKSGRETAAAARPGLSFSDQLRHDPERTSNVQRGLFEEDETDEDFFGGVSPPKTLQFHIPNGRLLQTPAKEASRRIVDDLLLTAGLDRTDEIEDDDFEAEQNLASPSLVGNRFNVDDDTF